MPSSGLGDLACSAFQANTDQHNYSIAADSLSHVTCCVLQHAAGVVHGAKGMPKEC